MKRDPPNFRILAAPLLAAAAATLLAMAPRSAAQVVTSQFDNTRCGANTAEIVLTPRNVNARQFGRLFRIPVDGDVYAQPLYLPRVRLGAGRVRDVLFVATEHGSVYAWDADRPTSAPLWHVSFARPSAGVTAVPFRDLHCPFIRPEVGITSTPAIDEAAGTIYVLARTREAGAGGEARYVQRLHALDVHNGAERPGSPVEIHATVEGSGEGSSRGKLVFDPLRQNPRASVLLTRGHVVLTWASSCDVGPYHGWVMTYDARSLEQLAVFNTSPDASQGGIWQGDTGPAADESGTIFAITGNGRFDAAGGGRNYGDTALALADGPGGLRVADSFTPFDQSVLDASDGDLGSGGPILAGGGTAGPRRLVFASKAGVLYVLDPVHLGGFHTGSNAGAVQSFETSEGQFGAPAYWNGHVYIQGSAVPLRDYPLADGRVSEKPIRESATSMPNPGATPTVSANGARDGIVWMIQSKPFGTEDRPAILRAYDASDVGRELYTSEQNPQRDRAGTALRFNIPTVASGRVYIGTKGGIDVYGLLPAPKPASRAR